ncbi:MAG: hydantoinase B/oxoprolinase family protein [Gammaproteobacteria bacterium]
MLHGTIRAGSSKKLFLEATLDAIELGIFASRLNAVCDEMGAVLQRAAFSPNIRDRLDFSCAVFDAQGELCAQAAHIPVHLGSMAYAMQDIISQLDWQDGDMVIVNDPYLGGTHLPDVTLIAPLLFEGKLLAFVVNRAHHADIGAESPGSMPLSKSLEEEGLVIPPSKIYQAGEQNQALLDKINNSVRSGDAGQGDLAAQVSANQSGLHRLQELIEGWGQQAFFESLAELNDYAERLARDALKDIPDGRYKFTDLMDDDDHGHQDIQVTATITVNHHDVVVDFAGTSDQVNGNINCPLSVAAAAVYYVFRCLMPAQTPACAGSFRPISITAPEGCLLNAQRPAAVAAGNVETSTRIVDVVMGALAKALPGKIPAASHGSMNNIAMGSIPDKWDYYETMGGGMGASSIADGIDGVQTHMTNTRNTPVEVMESVYPVRIKRYALRENSGGKGKYNGGDGLVREFEFLRPSTVTVLTERRRHVAWGLNQGEAGKAGSNRLNNQALPPKITFEVKTGDQLTIETPGGGGWGKAQD